MSLLTSFNTCFVCPQTQHIKSSAPICTYDAEDVFELWNSHDQELTVYHLVESQNYSSREEAEEREPELKARIITV